MSKNQKLLDKLRSNPSNIRWTELEKLLISLGYVLKQGKGSRVKFLHPDYGLISLHTPHPGPIVDTGAIKDVITKLQENGIEL
jgi:predicted RNA binding protein YcfA (HicA-like mRNA interferase family)